MYYRSLSKYLLPVMGLLPAQMIAAYEVEHSAHQHGAAHMNIVVEANQVAMEFESPLFNLLGFEHEARTEAERTLLQKQQRFLQQGQGVELSAAAECRLLQHELIMAADTEGHDEAHTEHDHDHADKAHHDDSHQAEEEHQDIQVHYLFECANPQQLNQIRIGWFQQFPDLTEIEVNLLSNQGANVVELTPANPVVRW